MKLFLFPIFILIGFNFVNAQTQANENLITYGGLPKMEDTSRFKIIYNSAFFSGYSDKYKSPLWTVYRLGNMKGGYNDSLIVKWERTNEFKVDSRTSSKLDHDAYTGSGFDRGHMAPNSAILVQYGQMAQLETFFMSNVSPQKPNLNQGIWKHLEEYERTILSQDDTKNKEVMDLYVICGPIFNQNPDTLKSGVQIPTAFYKILVYKKGYGGTYKAVSFIFPQEPKGGKGAKNFMDYVVTVDEIEKRTGIDFFPELSTLKQKNLESVKRNFDLIELE